eukprot:GSA25T00007421001.1
MTRIWHRLLSELVLVAVVGKLLSLLEFTFPKLSPLIDRYLFGRPVLHEHAPDLAHIPGPLGAHGHVSQEHGGAHPEHHSGFFHFFELAEETVFFTVLTFLVVAVYLRFAISYEVDRCKALERRLLVRPPTYAI